jgi:hypothetical protein
MRGQIAAIIGLVFFVILGGLTGYLSWNGYRAVAGSEATKGMRAELVEATREREHSALEVVASEKKLWRLSRTRYGRTRSGYWCGTNWKV